MERRAVLLTLLFCLGVYTELSEACTDFRIQAKDGSVLIARSMEFAVDFKSNLRTVLRGTTVTSTTPSQKSGLTWQSKYGFVYVDGLSLSAVVDGMNEKGLSFEYLYLPGETEYQALPEGQENRVLSYTQFGDWVLGNFATVDEVKNALKDIVVVATTMPETGSVIFPLHAAIYDASGKGIVVEFVKGQMRVHDNELGILTNSPTYDWHLTNLRNFINLSPYNPNPVIVNGLSFNATGQGAGMVGLPGDVSPPSRFVKVGVMLKNTLPVNNASDALNLSQHILNNVDIPFGLVRAKNTNGSDSLENTQWAVFKDLTNQIFYYRTYNDMTIRAVSLTKLDFSKGPLLVMPLVAKPFIKEVTSDFLNAKVIPKPKT